MFVQVVEGWWICDIVCVQNYYNIVYCGDDVLIDMLVCDGIVYVLYFLFGGFLLLQLLMLFDVVVCVGVMLMQVVFVWLLCCVLNFLLIFGMLLVVYLCENFVVVDFVLLVDVFVVFDCIVGVSVI